MPDPSLLGDSFFLYDCIINIFVYVSVGVYLSGFHEAFASLNQFYCHYLLASQGFLTERNVSIIRNVRARVCRV